MSNEIGAKMTQCSFFLLLKCLVLFVGLSILQYLIRGRCGRDRMVVGFTTTCAISTYHH